MRERFLVCLIALLIVSCGSATGEPSILGDVHCVRDSEVLAPVVWESEIEQYEASDAANPPAPGSIVFVGSSSIRFWNTLGADMAPMLVLNRGFGGR